MAGPWFTVVRSGTEWTRVARITLSDAQRTEPAWVELRLRFAAPDARDGDAPPEYAFSEQGDAP